MENKDLAGVLKEIGTILELQGENRFKCRAYYAAARTLETLDSSVADRVAEGTLGSLPGIGKALAEKITELVTTGKLDYHERIRAEIPEGLFDLLRIPDLGPKRVRTLHEKLGINSLAELEYEARCGHLKDVPGFGAKTELNVLTGIEMLKKMRGQYLLSDAHGLARRIVAVLQQAAAPTRLALAGSARRMKETVKDLDLLACGDAAAIMDALVGYERVEQVTGRGETKCSVRLDTGMAVDLRVVPEVSYPFALQYFTGSKEHNVRLRNLAKSKLGLKLNEYGLFKGDKPVPCAGEEELYDALGLSYIPPEMREDSGEVELAASGDLPVPVAEGDIQGLVHMHTTWSDGRNSIEEMALAAKKLGYKYIAITDHTVSSHVANGLTEARLKQQWKEIDAVNKKLKGIRVLKGAEVDIKADGSMDYSDAVLKKLDIVIAALHSGFKADRKTITGRVLKALANPYVQIFAHPTGRLLLGREPYAIDMEAVIKAAAKHGKVMEANANPHRLDLNWQHLKLCRKYGVKVSINPDAHHVEGFGCMPYGIGTARRGWITAAETVNTRPLDAFLAALPA